MHLNSLALAKYRPNVFVTKSYFKVALYDNLKLSFFLIYFSTGISSSTQTFKHYQTGAASVSRVAEGELVALHGCSTMMNYISFFKHLCKPSD